jgi:c-di-GMP-binding flagellar brake protein YcgR
VADQLNLDDLQSYGGPRDPVKAEQEQRLSLRALFASDAVLAVDGNELKVQTVDISGGGLCIGATKQLAVGKDCRLSFQLPVAGGTELITAQVSVIYCFYTGEEGFKAGLEFVQLAAASSEKIQRFVEA